MLFEAAFAKFKNFARSYKIFYLLFIGALFFTFQNCGKEFSSTSRLESAAEGEMDCLDDQGQSVVGCVPLVPETETRVCEITNGIGTQTSDGSKWSSCTAQSCDAGYEIKNAVCAFVETTRSCTIANGTGLQTNSGGGFGPCMVRSCSAGYHVVGTSSCAFTPITRVCTVANGNGTQTNTGLGFTTCDVQTCNLGYQEIGNQCSFIPITRNCTINNGTGTQTNTGAGFGACVAKTCTAGFHIDKGLCVFTPIVRSCTIANGTGTQINTGVGFGLCTVKSCSPGYHTVSNTCQFTPITRSCVVQNGTGTQTNMGLGFGPCQVTSCLPTHVEIQNSCQPKVRSCVVAYGTGEQTYSNGSFSACYAKSCNPNYSLFNKICVVSSAPTAKINFYILRKNDGTGNDLWTDEFVDMTVRTLSTLTLGNVKFVLSSNNNLKNTADYDDLLQKHASKFAYLRKFTEITAVIPNPGPVDSAGEAFNIRYNYEPFFAGVARNAPTIDGRARSAAQIILHELGHNMGMSHNYSQSVHMDNHYYLQPLTLVNYVQGLNQCTTEICQCRYAKYGAAVSCNGR